MYTIETKDLPKENLVFLPLESNPYEDLIVEDWEESDEDDS